MINLTKQILFLNDKHFINYKNVNKNISNIFPIRELHLSRSLWSDKTLPVINPDNNNPLPNNVKESTVVVSAMEEEEIKKIVLENPDLDDSKLGPLSNMFNKLIAKYPASVLDAGLSKFNPELREEIEKVMKDNLKNSKLLGEFGDLTLNEILGTFSSIKLVDYIDILKNIKVDPVIGSVASYGIMIRVYKKFVFDVNTGQNLKGIGMINHKNIKSRNLMVFGLLVCPILVACINYTKMDSGSTITRINNNVSQSSNWQFSLLSLFNLRNKVPRFFLRLLYVSLLILTYFYIGIENIKIYLNLINPSYCIFISLVGSTILLLYNIINLILLYNYRFNRETFKYPEILPLYLKGYLKHKSDISEKDELFNVYKDTYFREITVYVLLIFSILILLLMN